FSCSCGRARVNRAATTGPRKTAATQTTEGGRANQSDNTIPHHIPAARSLPLHDHDHESSLRSTGATQQTPLRSFYTPTRAAAGVKIPLKTDCWLAAPRLTVSRGISGNRSRVTKTEEAPAAPGPLRSWLMKGVREDHQANLAPHPSPQQIEKTPLWWQVMCLTGVDYFRPRGYQPGIGAPAAGVIAPIATVVLVALTLLGA